MFLSDPGKSVCFHSWVVHTPFSLLVRSFKLKSIIPLSSAVTLLSVHLQFYFFFPLLISHYCILLSNLDTNLSPSHASTVRFKALTCRRVQSPISDEVSPQAAAGSLWTERRLVTDFPVRLLKCAHKHKFTDFTTCWLLKKNPLPKNNDYCHRSC